VPAGQGIVALVFMALGLVFFLGLPANLAKVERGNDDACAFTVNLDSGRLLGLELGW
jgi:hypothetical protein